MYVWHVFNFDKELTMDDCNFVYVHMYTHTVHTGFVFDLQQ